MKERPPALPPAPASPEDDFTNLETIDGVLTSDDPARLEALKAFLREHDMADRDIEASVAMRRLRQATHEAMREPLAQRRAAGPPPTPEELSIGALVEQVEPHVRDALRVMRRKGYNTASSGFSDFNRQSVNLNEPMAAETLQEVRGRLAELGAEVDEKGSISFRAYEPDLGKLKERWDAIAEALPDLGAPAGDSTTPAARSFRKRA